MRGKLISRYVIMVRKAIVSNNRIADPRLNSKLAAVLAEAGKLNVPKATLERAIVRATNVKMITKSLDIKGPGGCAVIAQCETDNISNLRREVKKVIRHYDSYIMPDDTLISMFQSRGFIRAATKTRDGRDVSNDYAEEAAIMANAEEVTLERLPDATDEDLATAWIFKTDASLLAPCRGELEKFGLNILSYDLCLVPYRELTLDEEICEKLIELCEKLRELDQVVDVFHNVKIGE